VSDQASGGSDHGISLARMRAVVAALERRAGTLAGGPDHTEAADLDALLTDAAGWRLRLEAEQLRTKRRADAAQRDAPPDPAAHDEAEDLARRQELLDAELERLHAVISQLRARKDELEARRGL
jgi:hypothetical protein